MEERTIRDILESIGRTEKLVAENAKGLEELKERQKVTDRIVQDAAATAAETSKKVA